MEHIPSPRDGKIPDSHVWVTPKELGRAVGRSKAFVYQRIADGEIPARRVAGALRVRLADALAWIDQVTQ